ncbi:MAG: glutamate decarboxylase, partial [Ilumatobacteraceae bacterium]
MVHKHVPPGDEPLFDELQPPFTGRLNVNPIPKNRMPDSESTADDVYRIIHEELMLDGSSRLNMATFVSTWMEPEAERLMAETFDKNMIDKDEYPQTAEIERRCVNMVANLFNAPLEGGAVGVSTIGSSEAVMLAGLAMKWRWRGRRAAAALTTDRPNLVLGSNVQVVWEKFCRYWDVEPRYVPMENGRYVISADDALARCDENTIGVIAILGTTYTGEFEPIGELSAALDEVQERTGIDVPLHVDGASGAFVAPFTQPDLEWDFRLPRVKSINASGHKYGLVYPGVGWALWRDTTQLPEDLIFHTNYLGGDQPTFDLNFSRGASQIVAQYYNFLRMGRSGYTQIMQRLSATADHLAGLVENNPYLELMSTPDALPLVCTKVTDD